MNLLIVRPPLSRPIITSLFLKAAISAVRGDLDNKYINVLTGRSSCNTPFFHWSWAAAVLRQILAEFDPSTYQCPGSSGQFLAFEEFKMFIKTRSDETIFDRRNARADILLVDNPIFISRVGGIDRETITIQPHPDDRPYWRLLSLLFRNNFEYMQNWPGFHAVTDVLNQSCKSTDDDSDEGMDFGKPDLESDDSVVDGLMEALATVLEELEEATEKDFIDEEFQSGEDGIDSLGSEDLSAIASKRAHIVGRGEINHDDEEEAEGSNEVSMEDRNDMELATQIVDSMMSASNVFDIWIVYRQFSVFENNRCFSSEFEKFYKSKPFAAHWTTSKIYIDEDRKEYYQGHFPVEKPVKSFEDDYLESQMAFFTIRFENYLYLAHETRINELSLPDPANYVPFIPWERLHWLEYDSIWESIDKLGLSYDGSTVYGGVPQSRCNRLHHTMYVNEDLYQHHINDGYVYPGLLHKDMILFRISSLDESEFCQKLRSFWSSYNPESGTFYLLETLPGVKARLLLENKNIDWQKMVSYFEKKWRQRDMLDEQRKQLQSILGTEYNASYLDFLTYIDPREFDLTKSTYIGGGSYGNVFRVYWPRKLAWPRDAAEEHPGDVAVKIIKMRNRNSSIESAKAKFFKEVWTSTTNGPMLSNPSETMVGSEELALVFDYVAEGTVQNFLQRSLVQGEPLKSWTSICGMLGDIVTGLKTLHARGIAHRDLHMNNVLVESNSYPDSNDIEFTALLADLGEGKILNPLTTSTSSYNLGSPLQQVDAKKGDIRAWAQIGVEMIRINYDKFHDGDGVVRLPEKLMRMLEECLSNEPGLGYEANTLEFMIQEVTDMLSECEDWSTLSTGWIEGCYELPEMRKHLGSSLQLSSSWMDFSPS
ncbi:hypothetical protein PT974_11986 [Cladobotryum mycophilum]|uniref:Protein kinase domain-containing protein n=1 Tax=Cladobotryum mycophilum TaxID=491253 RepID=A0ABR0S6T1_9HYPO